MSVEEKVRAQLLALKSQYVPRIRDLENDLAAIQQQLSVTYLEYAKAQQEVFDENY